MEVYSPRRVLDFTAKVGLTGNVSADLLTGWNFSNEADRVALVVRIAQDRPKVLLLSPPCTMFSSWTCMNWPYMEKQTREERWQQACVHLQFSMFLCMLQARSGRGYVFEHPKTAMSWKNPVVQQVRSHKSSMMAELHMCHFGMCSPSSPHLFYRKATLLMTNVAAVKKHFDLKICPKNHQHIAIQGSEPGGARRSFVAQHYPKAFCEAMAAAIAEHCSSNSV